MTIEPATPVLIGVGTANQREAEPGGGVDTTTLVIEACRAAIDDAGAAGLAGRIGWIGATRGLDRLPDPARRVAEALGADARTVVAEVGIPQQTLVNAALDAIRSGRTDLALVTGGETKYRADTARRAGIELPGHDQAGLEPDEEMTPAGEIVARPEIDVGAVAPVQQYAMIDNARRAAEGMSVAEHRDDIAALWHGFNRVAGANPRADFGTPMSAAEIRDPGPDNRPLAFPYNKWHNSQWAVDQAAALLFASAEAAEASGVPRDRWVFPHVGLESSHSLSLSRRAELHRWPAMGVLGGAAERHLGMALDDVAHLELYSCFPAAVRVQQAELGIDRARVPSVTGGMAFAGGPFNNFVYQATVEVVDRVRAEPGSRGAVTAVSGLLTKPGLAVWGAEPPARGLLLADLAEEAASATATVPLDEDPDGEGTVATYTVTYDGETPARVVAVVDLDSGSRAVAVLDEPAAAESATVEELIGARVAVKGRALRLS